MVTRYVTDVIRSFADKRTAAIFGGRFARRLDRSVQQYAKMKLDQIDASRELNDLRLAPSNRLEKRVGGRSGQWSIRVNDQWRICLDWRNGDAFDVELADHH